MYEISLAVYFRMATLSLPRGDVASVIYSDRDSGPAAARQPLATKGSDLMTPRNGIVLEKDLQYAVSWFDENWNEIPNSHEVVGSPTDVMRLIREWKRIRYLSIGVDLTDLDPLAKAAFVGLEVVYVGK